MKDSQIYIFVKLNDLEQKKKEEIKSNDYLERINNVLIREKIV